MRYGCLEAGGTKMVCAVADEQKNILEEKVFPTDIPEITVPLMIDFFRDRKIDALGIGCFGPLDLRKDSKTYGYITSTPKKAWKNYNMAGVFKNTLRIPVGFDTDVNAAMLGEAFAGAAADVENAVYITVGTGIGAGIFVNGKLVHGMLHPEAGHISLMRHEKDKDFFCTCPYHTDCFEGLAAGPAIKARFGVKACDMKDDDEALKIIAYYIAQAVSDYILVVSPERVILGGGVMEQKALYPLIRKDIVRQLNGYLDTEELGNMEEYLVSPKLNGKQGIVGCAVLAEQELSLCI